MQNFQKFESSQIEALFNLLLQLSPLVEVSNFHVTYSKVFLEICSKINLVPPPLLEYICNTEANHFRVKSMLLADLVSLFPGDFLNGENSAYFANIIINSYQFDDDFFRLKLLNLTFLLHLNIEKYTQCMSILALMWQYAFSVAENNEDLYKAALGFVSAIYQEQGHLLNFDIPFPDSPSVISLFSYIHYLPLNLFTHAINTIAESLNNISEGPIPKPLRVALLRARSPELNKFVAHLKGIINQNRMTDAAVILAATFYESFRSEEGDSEINAEWFILQYLQPMISRSPNVYLIRFIVKNLLMSSILVTDKEYTREVFIPYLANHLENDKMALPAMATIEALADEDFTLYSFICDMLMPRITAIHPSAYDHLFSMLDEAVQNDGKVYQALIDFGIGIISDEQGPIELRVRFSSLIEEIDSTKMFFLQVNNPILIEKLVEFIEYCVQDIEGDELMAINNRAKLFAMDSQVPVVARMSFSSLALHIYMTDTNNIIQPPYDIVQSFMTSGEMKLAERGIYIGRKISSKLLPQDDYLKMISTMGCESLNRNIWGNVTLTLINAIQACQKEQHPIIENFVQTAALSRMAIFGGYSVISLYDNRMTHTVCELFCEYIKKFKNQVLVNELVFWLNPSSKNFFSEICTGALHHALKANLIQSNNVLTNSLMNRLHGQYNFARLVLSGCDLLLSCIQKGFRYPVTHIVEMLDKAIAPIKNKEKPSILRVFLKAFLISPSTANSPHARVACDAICNLVKKRKIFGDSLIEKWVIKIVKITDGQGQIKTSWNAYSARILASALLFYEDVLDDDMKSSTQDYLTRLFESFPDLARSFGFYFSPVQILALTKIIPTFEIENMSQ